MSLPSGTYDQRKFRHFARMNDDGTVAAIVEVADGTPDPTNGANALHVEVTDLFPYDLSAVKASAIDVIAAKAALSALPTALALIALAKVRAVLAAGKVQRVG